LLEEKCAIAFLEIPKLKCKIKGAAVKIKKLN